MSQENDFSSNNWVIKEELGSGTFGSVHAGFLKSNGLKIAIKRVKKAGFYKYNNYEYMVQAFYKEIECMKKCSCENSVKLYKFIETENNYNIIMEYCDGDLSKELKKRPNGFSVEEVRYIMTELNNAFRKLYEQNIIHRDLKLGNILITYTDETKTKFKPKLCDYGFSKELDNNTTNTKLGTPQTMAPEVLANQPYDCEADLWSIGVIIYQLHFKDLPYLGRNDREILKKIKKKTPYKQAEDPQLRDLINKLLVIDPKKRLTWKDYFNHPFFGGEDLKNKINIKEITNKANEINIGKGKRYVYQSDFDVGFKNGYFKCCIAYDKKNDKKVLIKSYQKDFVESHEFQFKMEYHLMRTFKKNENFLELINIDNQDDYHLVFDFIDCEILPVYMSKNEFDENKIQILNKELIEKVFNYSEIYLKPFIFISLYSFAITKEGKPIVFDVGLNKFFIPTDEINQYYIPNMPEIGYSLYPIKTNVMNYGITLLKCFYGKNFEIKIKDEEIVLPDDPNKIFSKEFKSFLSKCLKKNILTRSSWENLKKKDFILNIQSNIEEKPKEENTLINDKKMEGIFKSLDTKYDLINKYYDSLEINENTPYTNEIEKFLILMQFEELIFLKILKSKDYKYSDNKKEISFISISRDQVEELKINFANPILKNMYIFSDKEIINSFIPKLEKHIDKLKEISLKFHKITKSTFFKGDYNNFLNEFCKIIIDDKFIDYFLSLTKEANEDMTKKNYEKARLKSPISEYLSETVIFIIINIINIEKEKIYFQKEEFLKKFVEFFEKEDKFDIEVSCINIKKRKDKYILVSFLGLFYKYLINMLDINPKEIDKKKGSIGKLIEIYHKIMKILVEIE